MAPRFYAPLLTVLLFFYANSPMFAQSVRPDANEPDSMISPQVITPGNTWISRTIHEKDFDWFTLTVDANRSLLLETTGNVDIYMVLYDVFSGEELASDDDGGDGENAKIDYYSPVKTSYLIKVTSYNSADTGPYQFQARTEVVPPDTSEPNDSRSQATVLRAETPFNGMFQSDSDVDWYRLTVPAGGGQLLTYTESSRDTFIEVWGTADEKLAEDDDSGSNYNAQVRVVVPAGTVYIKVTEYNKRLGRYTLHARIVEPPKPDSYENDNTAATAKPITLGTPQQHTFSDASDVDWVRFTVTQAGSYEIRSTAVADSSLDSYLELYDTSERSINENDDDGDSLDARIRQKLEPGTYLIKVHTLNSELLGDSRYTLSVSLIR
jgi:hypothetical protein